MKFDKKINEYLSNKNFTNGLKVSVSEKENSILSRIEILDELLKNKNVIHVGCCDHIPLIETKIKNNLWLHKRITNVANRCLGIDIDKEGIEYLRNKLGYTALVCADINKENISEITRNKWDYIILGEILEHIDNPVEFLSNIKLKYSNNVEKIIVSVPNAFRYQNFKNSKKHIEFINSDHRYWFTPYTLAKVFARAGFIVDEFFLCMEKPVSLNFRKKIKKNNKRLLNYPLFRDTILMTAKVS